MYILVVLILAIALMVFAISRWNVHSFLAILFTSFLLALFVGVPPGEIPTLVEQGFSSIIGGIGLVIIFGALIGIILEKTGAALKLADMVVKWLGDRYPQLSILLIGWIVSIPVFCDSGFILLNSVRRALCNKTGISSAGMAIALSAGLYTSHVLIPPTPGAIAAAGMAGLESNLLLVILIGVAVSPFCLLPSYFFSRYIGKKITDIPQESPEKEYDALLDSYPKLPGGFLSILPILLPVVLMACGSIAKMACSEGVLLDTALFLGKPVIALIIGFLFALLLLVQSGRMGQLTELTNDVLKSVAPIIFITAAGSVLGKVIVASNFIEIIQSQLSILIHLGLLFPFLIAAMLKSAQGSSTVAMITTASIMGLFSASDSLMATLGFNTPFLATLAVMSIGSGAMVVSHANDSYFWVVTGFGGIKTEDGYRSQTLMSLINGVGGLVGVYVLYLLYLCLS